MKEILDKIVTEHDLINRTFEALWERYDNFLVDEASKEKVKELGLVDRNSVNAKYFGYWFMVSKDYDFVHIKICIDMYLKDESLSFGECWGIYDLQGKSLDVNFIIE